MVEEISLDLNDQARSGRPKTMDSKALQQAIEANPGTSIPKVSSELGIPESNVVQHFHDLRKNILSC